MVKKIAPFFGQNAEIAAKARNKYSNVYLTQNIAGKNYSYTWNNIANFLADDYYFLSYGAGNGINRKNHVLQLLWLAVWAGEGKEKALQIFNDYIQNYKVDAGGLHRLINDIDNEYRRVYANEIVNVTYYIANSTSVENCTFGNDYTKIAKIILVCLGGFLVYKLVKK